MSFIDNIKSIFIGSTRQRIEQLPSIYNGEAFSISKAESISTVSTCVKILGETIGRLPLEIYQADDKRGSYKDKDHYLYDILHYNPNGYTTSQSFFTALETHRNLKGNAFARIVRNNGTGRVLRLEIINPDLVVGYAIENNELYYKVLKDKKTEETETINSNDILHFRMVTKDGIWGINPIEALRSNLSTTYKAYSTIDNFYQNGVMSPKAIKSTVSGANQKAMLEALEKFKEEYAGSANAGKIIPLPPNSELQEMQMNLADAQFIETIKFNANQIAALFGIPPHLVGNYEASKFNNVEQLQLNFKVNTIAAIARMYRQELEYKLLLSKERRGGKSIEFNLMGLVETDHRSRLEGYRTLANIGVMSPNDIAKIENYPTYEGGNQHYVPSNFIAVETLAAKAKEGNVKNKLIET